MTYRQVWIACALQIVFAAACWADIFRWDNRQRIPGTEGITPGPGVQLDHRNLDHADLQNKNLTSASFSGANLRRAHFAFSNLRSADLTNAVVAGAIFLRTTGFTKEQLYATASYKAKDLQAIQLSNIDQYSRDLSGWDFSGQNLSGAGLVAANLTNADLTGANLTSAGLSAAKLAGASLTGANVTGARFESTTPLGLTKEQLYSTSSYQSKDLRGISFRTFGHGLESHNNLTGWDFSGQNLTDANFDQASLTNVDLAGAVVKGASFDRARGFTKEQLYETASYQSQDLPRIGLGGIDLTGWDFSGQNLAQANFAEATLTDADFTGTVVTAANFAVARGFTKEQLYATATFKSKNLQNIGLAFQNLANVDFSGFDLGGASFAFTTLTNANLQDATVTQADFSATTSSGFTKEQLYKTANFQAKDLQGISLSNNDLTGWDFSGQNLSNASFAASKLANAKLTGAIILGANFNSVSGFTKEQLYSTGSYQAKDLRGFSVSPDWFPSETDLTGWDFSGQNLTGAGFDFAILTNASLRGANLTSAHLSSAYLTNTDFTGANLSKANLWEATLETSNLTGTNLTDTYFVSATLTNVNLTGADTRGSQGLQLASVVSRNAILPDGKVTKLDLAMSDRLLVRDDDGFVPPTDTVGVASRSPIAVTVHDRLAMAGGSVLQLLFDADPWGSLISFEPGIPVELGGSLELKFADDVDLRSQVGRTLRIFDWTGVSPTGQFDLSGPYVWDVANLYATGEVTLIAVPEPSTASILVVGVLALAARRRLAISRLRH
jgi:uncharacterized protein YjbI with pentapeptide repeats